MAAAAFLIRDDDLIGHNITILEESEKIGGSLDGCGSPETGYVVRGGRMIETKYLCTYDLFSSIPTLDDSKTVTKEIFDWNETVKTCSKARLAIEPEALLGDTSIEDQFDAGFFETGFLVHVVHDLRLSSLAQRGRVQALTSCVSLTWSTGSIV
jgi:oleate hydratase